ncbi:MAG: hypothetical protein ACUZ8E_14385, partial [Candidatus Anammoxibacter sp.]
LLISAVLNIRALYGIFLFSYAQMPVLPLEISLRTDNNRLMIPFTRFDISLSIGGLKFLQNTQ